MKISHRLAGFRDETDGAILVFGAVSMAVFLGLAALSFDVGRAASTQAELQSFADHVALAAAGELDGRADAITRATAAASGLIDGRQTFGDGTQDLGGAADYVLTFLSGLPGDDAAPPDALATTDPAVARYVRVAVNPRTVQATFAAAFGALTGEPQPDAVVGAEAVAGYTSYICRPSAMLFCLPNAGYRADPNRGDMITLKAGGANTAWGPGNFGWIDPEDFEVDPNGPCAGLTGINITQCLLGARGSLVSCTPMDGVHSKPGQHVGSYDGIINMRFDIYTASFTSNKNSVAYAPAPNVIKGIVPSTGGQCIGNNASPSPNTVALPRDACIISGACGRFGDGVWDRAGYVAANHGGIYPAGTSTTSTRHEMYLAEIANPATATRLLQSGKAESGRPSCSSHVDPNPDRRVIIAAGVDCSTYQIQGSAEDVPVTEYFKIFLTEPTSYDAASNFTVYGEIIGSAGGAGAGNLADGIVREVVQLYR